MFHVVLPSIETLFAAEGRPRQVILFNWWLIRRRRQPFLLLPTTMANARAGLELYAAQRQFARICRAILPLILKTPAAYLFEQVRFEADANSEIMQFLARQCDVPVIQMQAPAIKFTARPQEKSRLVLLLCDETRRPVSVVKVGLNPSGRGVINREADILEKLPVGTPGCIRMTGRLNTPQISAFATAFFPGGSPNNDAGMERLFHAWLNPDSPVPLTSLPTWQELAAAVTEADASVWKMLNAKLAGKTIRTTLHHGDFSPWNIRAINMQNLQVYDWERCQLHGIPGWDWFQFHVQSAVLVRRLSIERVAAEVEQLLDSDRFKRYAAEAGISDIAQPLVLAYLLYQQRVIKPRDRREAALELLELLCIRWQMLPQTVGSPLLSPATSGDRGLWGETVLQLKHTAAQLSNLFWEPSLTARVSPSMRSQFLRHWSFILLSGLVLVGVTTAFYYFTSIHLVLLPLYLVPCALLTWKVDRRWGALAAAAAAVAGPVIQSVKDPDLQKPEIVIWNIVMRFITLQLCVLFVEQIHRQKMFHKPQATPNQQPAIFSRPWAVVLASGVLFLIVAALDFILSPQLVFLPLYLLPCMILTLTLNLRWGIVAALVATLSRSLMQYFEIGSPDYLWGPVFWWNFFMFLALFLIVVVLLDQIRRGSILFFSSSVNRRQVPPGDG